MIKYLNHYSKIKTDLLKWYDSNTYNFPWRDTANPYNIYLSEVMLQQTQVVTARSYYLNWLKSFPTIADVAKASLQQVLKHWEGLGYYGRARNFHKSCKIISQKYNQTIPNNFDEFIKLPGVGAYTAGAVLSISYNNILPAVDSNTVRVVSRLEMNNIPYPKNIKSISRSIMKYICSQRPGDFNQAIMDLGREICKSKNPKCTICPISLYCKSYINNLVYKYPKKIKKKIKKHYNIGVGVVIKNKNILISKRFEDGLLGGLWEFPGGKINNHESIEECIIREIKEELNITVKPKLFIKQIKHSYSHFSITMDAYFCELIEGSPASIGCADWKWISLQNINLFPFPKANHKLFDEIFLKFNDV